MNEWLSPGDMNGKRKDLETVTLGIPDSSVGLTPPSLFFLFSRCTLLSLLSLSLFNILTKGHQARRPLPQLVTDGRASRGSWQLQSLSCKDEAEEVSWSG